MNAFESRFGHHSSKALAAPRNKYVLEIATLATRVASALCDTILGVNFLKPVVGMTVTINGYRAGALALARHAEEVTNFIVEKASNGEKDADSAAALRLALEDVQAFLKLVKSTTRCGDDPRKYGL
ncbi:hypothetical protein K438DRAFT_1965665 [Mycena galopus ATCC 62051]|nr:hypothetical protein K438DRAFT_1965665 [Mycena galopus ATCC 62051]